MLKLSQILLSPKKAKNHPLGIFLVAFTYASISLLISLWIFPEYASLFMVFLTVISCLYLIEGTLITEEKHEKNETTEKNLLARHSKTIWFLMVLFFGFLAAFTFWTIVLPEDLVLNAFDVQKSAFDEIRSITGRATAQDIFSIIFLNNMRVLLLSLLLALFYGAGALFILVWNASIMGFVMGSLAKNILGLAALPQIFLKYFIHGIPEIAAYFTASLAGGILFIALLKGDLKKGRARRTLTDTLVVLSIAIALLIIAALIETYISPRI